MSIIDWSDPDEMFGLLLEYVADELLEEESHPERADFLRALLSELDALEFPDTRATRIVDAIEEIRAAQPRDFLNDPVIAHLDDCVEELRRIDSTTRVVPGGG